MVEGCRRGDRRAQKALYEEFAPMALGVCMRFASDRDAAQDLMQDGFVRVYEKIGLLRETEHLKGWIYRTMINVCIRDYQRRKRQIVQCDETADDNLPPLDPFGTEQVVMALQQLPRAQRLVFNLTEVEGYSYAETAKELKCSEVNVRALLSRAKAGLRTLLTQNRQ